MKVRTPLCSLVLLVAIAVVPAAAQQSGDDVWEEHILGSRRALQAYFDEIAQLDSEKTSYQLLFEAWNAMAPLPYGRDGLPLISEYTLHPDESVWPDIVRWVRRPQHETVVDLVNQAGEASDDDEHLILRAFGLPYGGADLDPDYIDADFVASDEVVELLVHGIGFHYLDAIRELEQFVFAEAYRLGEEGEVFAACELLTSWIRIGRQIADRDFIWEKQAGMEQMIDATKIMRNILYRHQSEMSIEQYREIVDGLTGLYVERIRLPEADKWATLSVIGDTFVRRYGVNEEVFVETYIGLMSQRAALAAFGSRERAEEIAAAHAGYFDTVDETLRIWGDLEFRWNIEDPFDAAVAGDPYILEADMTRFRLPVRLLYNLIYFEPLREDVYIAVEGTRGALAVLAYIEKQGDMPAEFVNIKPRYIDDLPFDPHDDREQRNKRQMHYFVPVRDYPPVGPRELPQPYAIEFETPSGATPILEINDANQYEEFVIYSKGPNLENDFLQKDLSLREWQPGANESAAGDIMVWPPLEELLRSRGMWP
jgi:hypothetical protein